MATAYYTSDHIEVTFSGNMERNDYGVPNSPVWYEVDPSSIKVDSLTILGIDVKFEDLADDLANAILDLVGEVEFSDE